MKIKNKYLKIIALILSIFFWILAFEVIARIINKPLILPSPSSVFITLVGWLPSSKLWITVLTSLLNVLFGTFLGLLLGFIFAIITYNNEIINVILQPVTLLIKVTPVASFILIMIVWFKGESRSSIPSIISSLIVFPIVFSNIKSGIVSVDTNLIEVGYVFGFSKLKQIKYIYTPSLLPFVLSSFKSSLGLAWKAGISAEILTTPMNSIGREMSDAKNYFETTNLFAWSIVVILLSLLVEKLIFFFIDLLIKKINGSRGETSA